MRNRKYLLPFVLIFVLFGCASTRKDTALKSMPPDTPVQHIHITAQRFEYTPDTIHVKQGTHVILEIESLDAIHGFRLDEYGINVTVPSKEKTKVEFYAREPGTFPFRCSHFCGTGHFGMKGKIVVD